MNLPDINWKYLLIVIVLVVIVALVLLFVPQNLSAKTINAYFSPTNKLAPGQNTNLIIELTNTLGKDVGVYDVSVKAINSGIIVGSFQKPEGVIGSGEMRKMTVPISLNSTLLEGTYLIEIDVSLDSSPFSSRVALEVKK
jgi:hypothetical protein